MTGLFHRAFDHSSLSLFSLEPFHVLQSPSSGRVDKGAMLSRVKDNQIWIENYFLWHDDYPYMKDNHSNMTLGPWTIYEA